MEADQGQANRFKLIHAGDGVQDKANSTPQ
jgi:hypothetical protein